MIEGRNEGSEEEREFIGKMRAYTDEQMTLPHWKDFSRCEDRKRSLFVAGKSHTTVRYTPRLRRTFGVTETQTSSVI